MRQLVQSHLFFFLSLNHFCFLLRFYSVLILPPHAYHFFSTSSQQATIPSAKLLIVFGVELVLAFHVLAGAPQRETCGFPFLVAVAGRVQPRVSEHAGASGR